MRLTATLLLAALAACASTSVPPEERPALFATDVDAEGQLDPTNVLTAGFHPTPFSAAEIREACTDGSYRTFRSQGMQMPGSYLRMTFTGGTDESCTVLNTVLDERMEPVSELPAPPTTWSDLQAHGSYPAEVTTVVEAEAFVTAGEFDCWLYRVEEPDGGVWEYSFARELPGPPVLLRHLDAEGNVDSWMELVAHGEGE